MHVHAIEDVFAQLLPRHLGRGARPARGCSARRQPVGTGAAGRGPGVGNSFRPPTGSSVLFSGGAHWLGGTEGPRPQPHLHGAAAVRQPHGNILPAGLGDGPLVVLCVGWRQPSSGRETGGGTSASPCRRPLQAFSLGLFCPVPAQHQDPRTQSATGQLPGHPSSDVMMAGAGSQGSCTWPASQSGPCWTG